MDRKVAEDVLNAIGRPAFKVKETGTVITFARQGVGDVEEIEKMRSQELVKYWKSLVWMNYIYGQVSVNEMQRIRLLELEIDGRKDVDVEKLNVWYEKEEIKYKKEVEKNEMS